MVATKYYIIYRLENNDPTTTDSGSILYIVQYIYIITPNTYKFKKKTQLYVTIENLE